LVQIAHIDLVYYFNSTQDLPTPMPGRGGSRGRRPREEVGNEVAHGVLQREAGDPGALRHRGAAPSGGGPVGSERGSGGISITSEKGPAELVRAGAAHRGARRKRLGPLPNRAGERTRTTCRRASARSLEARAWNSNSESSRSAISRSPS